ncbi:bacteriocin ABC transporter [Firmicutes bacterium CAG:582]|mgnify:FL=1|nr:bacteriocin ABC transporter [Firmicutes bacterium CAG:582]
MVRKNVEVIQEEKSDCGVSCLLSIIKYYGGDESLENLRISSLTTDEGVSAYNLIECAKQYGFDCIGIKEKNIDKLNLPCIAHLKINNTLSHFVVIYDRNASSVIIMDPAVGLIKEGKSIFESKFTGVVISLYPKEKLMKKKIKNILWQNIFKELKKSKWSLILIIILNLIFVLLSIVYSNYIQLLNITNPKSVILFIIIIIILKLIEYEIAKITLKLDAKVGKSITSNFFDYIFSLPLRILHLKNSGEIIKRVCELDEVKSMISNTFIQAVLSSLYIFNMLIAISIINLKLCFIIFVFCLLVIIFCIKKYKKLKFTFNNYIYESTKYNVLLQDTISSISSIKHMNQEQSYSEKLSDAYNEFITSYKIANITLSKIDLMKNIMLGIMEFLVISVMLFGISKGNYFIQDILIIQLLLNFLLTSFNSMLGVLPTFILESKIVRKVNEFYNINVENNGGDNFENGDIKFSNVTFSYNNYENTIEKITFEIEKGSHVTLNGVSGSGKSTLMRLLNREYDDYSGKIMIGSKEIRNIKKHDYAEHIIYSSQNEKFINGTIKENILFERKIPDEDFNKIINICLLDKVIKKYPLGFDTYISSQINPLSGGEKNLVILARTLIEHKDIYILDEVLSELNYEKEIEVLKNIDRNIKSTIIYISHKKSNIFKEVFNVRKE